MKTRSLQALDAFALVGTLAGLAPVVTAYFKGTRPASAGTALSAVGLHWVEGLPVVFLLFALVLAVCAFAQYVTSPDTPLPRWQDCVPLETWVGFAGAGFFTWLLVVAEGFKVDPTYQLTMFLLVVALALYSLKVTEWIALHLLRYMVNLAYPGAYELVSGATPATTKELK